MTTPIVLALDDNLTLLDILNRYLLRWGYSPRITSTVSEFYAQLKRETPDVILLDVMIDNLSQEDEDLLKQYSKKELSMPGLNIRDDLLNRFSHQLPIIMLTSIGESWSSNDYCEYLQNSMNSNIRSVPKNENCWKLLPNALKSLIKSSKPRGLINRGLKIVLYGAGRVGTTIGTCLRNQTDFPVDNISVITRSEKTAKNAAEIILTNTTPEFESNYRQASVEPINLKSAKGRQELLDADIVFLTLMQDKNPVNSNGHVDRSQHIFKDLPGIVSAARNLRDYSGLCIIGTGPIEPMCQIFQDFSHLNPSQIVGFRNVDSERFNIVAKQFFEKYDMDLIVRGLVVGHHGDYMYPDLEHSKVQLKQSGEILSIEELIRNHIKIDNQLLREQFLEEINLRVPKYFYGEYGKFGSVSITIGPAGTNLIKNIYFGNRVSASVYDFELNCYTGNMPSFKVEKINNKKCFRWTDALDLSVPGPLLEDRKRNSFLDTRNSVKRITEWANTGIPPTTRIKLKDT